MVLYYATIEMANKLMYLKASNSSLTESRITHHREILDTESRVLAIMIQSDTRLKVRNMFKFHDSETARRNL